MPSSSRRSRHRSSSGEPDRANPTWSSPVRRSSNASRDSAPMCVWSPKSWPPSRRNTVWWKVPDSSSSSSTGSAPKRLEYHRVLRSRSETVIATCCRPGKATGAPFVGDSTWPPCPSSPVPGTRRTDGPPSARAAEVAEEPVDHLELPGARHDVVDVLADGEVEHAQAERREHHRPVV